MTPKKSYVQIINERQKESEVFFDKYAFAAFSNEQAEEGMRKLGYKYPDDVKQFVGIGAGMYVLRDKVAEMDKLFDRYDKMIDEGLKDDEWAIDALAYEIQNHDYMYDEDNEDALRVFGQPGGSEIIDPRWKMIHKKAIDRALGIDTIQETPENKYYLDCRRTDPSYTADDAIKEWLSDNEDVAVGLARQYWVESEDYDAEPFDWDYFEEILDSMGAMEAFTRGHFAHDFSFNDPYVMVDGYGNFYTISESEFVDKCVELAEDSQFREAILEGKLQIPPDMAEIVGIFAWDKDKLTVSQCKRSRHAITSKSRKIARTTSTVRKTKAPAKKVQPRKKTVSRNKSKPTVSNGKRARMTKTNHFKGGVVTTRKDKIAKQKPKTKITTRKSRGARQ